jgi:glycosyltransferase involved in cell wall biosynthesis
MNPTSTTMAASGGTAPELSLLLLLDMPGRAARALASLARQSLPREHFEIIGVSAGATVPSELRDALDWVVSAAKPGPGARARALNRAARLATGRIVALCDADAVFPPGFAGCLATSFGAEGSHARQPVVTLIAAGPDGAPPSKQALALYRQDAQLVMSAGAPDMPLEDVAWLLVESGAQHLRLDAAPEATGSLALDWRDIPVFIVNRNRHQALEQLVRWLTDAGTRKVVIFDNGSTYPPLLEYYSRLPEGVSVLRLEQNFGPYVLWEQGVHRVMDTPYILTDSDIVPADFCPADLIARLLQVMQQYPDATKVGPALRIDNLPDGYTDADTVRKWESQFWEHPVAPGVFAAPIDTTFALYPPRAEFSLDDRALRLGYPYISEHTPWYAQEATLSDEERYYRTHTSKTFSNWSVRGKQSKTCMSDRVKAFERRAKVLNIDDSGEYIPGWINAGRGPRALDMALDLNHARDMHLPLADGTLDGIRLSHSLDGVDDMAALLRELRRVVRDGAKLQVRLVCAAAVTTRNWQRSAGIAPLLEVATGHGWEVQDVRLVTDKASVAQRLTQATASNGGSRVQAVVLTSIALERADKIPSRQTQRLPEAVLVSDDRLPPHFVTVGRGGTPRAKASASPAGAGCEPAAA